MKYKLEDICNRIYSGGTPSTTHKEYWNGDLPWLSSGETSQRFVYTTEKFITKEGVQKSSTKYAKRNSIVMASAGQGHTRGQVSFLMNDMYINQSVLVFEPEVSIVNPLYLYYNLDGRYEELRQLSDGTSTRGSLSGRIVKGMEIDLPNLSVQGKIVSVLYDIDKKIENNNQINRNLSEQAMAIFTDLFGDADKDATVDEVSLNVTDGVHNTVKDDSEGKFFLLSCKNIKGGSLSLGEAERRINQETFEKLRKRTKLEKGDILLSSVGTIGELLLMSFDPDKYEFQRSVAIIKPNSDVVSSEYLYCALLAQKQEIIRAAHGAVQQCIFISDIKGFTIHKPTSERLIQFDNAVVPMMKMIYQNEEENKRLSLLRDTLLPKLMSGELDVSELDI